MPREASSFANYGMLAGLLVLVNAFPIIVMFGMCSIFLFMASILQRRLMVIADRPKSKPQDWTALREMDGEEELLYV
ncbi:uncharacterized protein LOC109724558 isoform X3 [Ananas comosus]|uniref:Uncharacterized protein LOC109724558 isoform X3 n=1 Tax=Ananas comosus TaxID=4615 RepID=A0A6P5GSZ8_ANACO|nr:uncharacterized protein LOC109724558 isoform X3 [Ananas comosus]